MNVGHEQNKAQKNYISNMIAYNCIEENRPSFTL